MSGEVILATPARPLCEPFHRPPKKDRPKSLYFFAQMTRFGELLPISEMGHSRLGEPVMLAIRCPV